jgi:hypothetical protein
MTSKSSFATAQKLPWTDGDLIEEEEKFNSEWDNDDVDDDDDNDDNVEHIEVARSNNDQQILHETIHVIDEAPNHVPTTIRSTTTIITGSIPSTSFSETPIPTIPPSSQIRPPLSVGTVMRFVGSNNSTDTGKSSGGGGDDEDDDVGIMTATPRVLLTSMNRDGNDDNTPLSLSSNNNKNNNAGTTPLSSNTNMDEGDFEEIMRERNRVSMNVFLNRGCRLCRSGRKWIVSCNCNNNL